MSLRFSEAEFEELRKRVNKADRFVPLPAKSPLDSGFHPLVGAKKARKGPNKTESEYAMRLRAEFPGCEPRFEAITLRLSNGHRYTPDWVVMNRDCIVLLVEVKNRGYKHASYGRARLAFDQAKLDFPMFSFRWSEKSGGRWHE